MEPLRVGSLFSGIGGIELGLERAGMRTVFQVESDPYAQKVLAKHWPQVPRFDDVRQVGAACLPACDVLCGGFPCQDISTAGRREGITGARSGLWGEFARIIREMGPRYVLVENVSALLVRGMRRVAADLAALGYDTEWDCLPAAALGAPHRRDRLFLVAHARGQYLRQQPEPQPRGGRAVEPARHGEQRHVADADGGGQPQQRPAHHDHGQQPPRDDAGGRGADVANTDRCGRDARQYEEVAAAQGRGAQGPGGRGAGLAEWRRMFRPAAGRARRKAQPGLGGVADGLPTGLDPGGRLNAWGPGWEGDVPRVAYSVPARTHRLRVLGNAVVPQVAQWVGERIVAHAETMTLD